MALLYIDKLPIPEWGRTSGVGMHIARLNAILPGDVTLIRDYIERLEVAPNTMANYCIGFKSAVVRYFGSQYLTDYSLRMAIDFFFKSITPKRDRRSHATFLSEDLIRQLIDGSGLRTSLWIQNLYTIGRRVSELCNLRLDSLRRETSDLYVAQVRAKGGYWDTFRIPAELVEINRAVFRGKIYMLETKDRTRNNRGNVLKLCYAAGLAVLGQTVHPHTFRHSFASHQIKKNPGKIKAIMSQGGWHDGRIFLSTYCHDEMAADDFLMMPQKSILAQFEGVPSELSLEDFWKRAG